MEMKNKMNQLFNSFQLTQEGIEKLEKVSIQFDDLLIFLSKQCEESREFSLCKTKLEEACFYAKKSISITNHKK
jgi:hypothetical protein